MLGSHLRNCGKFNTSPCIMKHTTDAAACCPLCSRNPLCGAFHVDSTYRECYLLDAVGARRAKAVGTYNCFFMPTPPVGTHPKGAQACGLLYLDKLCTSIAATARWSQQHPGHSNICVGKSPLCCRPPSH